MKQLSPEARTRIWSVCFQQVRRRWQFWVGVVVAMAIFIAVFLLIKSQLTDLNLPSFVEGAIAGGSGGLLAGTLMGQVVNRLAVPLLRTELAKLAGPSH